MMNYLFYPCSTLAAHTNTRVLELLVLRNSRIPSKILEFLSLVSSPDLRFLSSPDLIGGSRSKFHLKFRHCEGVKQREQSHSRLNKT